MEDTTYEASSISEFLAAWLVQRPLSAASQKLVEDYYASFRGLRSERMYIIEAETENGTVLYGNERILSAARLAKEFEPVGIRRKQSVRYFRLFPSHALFDSLFGLERAMVRVGLGPMFSHYNFVGRKTG